MLLIGAAAGVGFVAAIIVGLYGLSLSPSPPQPSSTASSGAAPPTAPARHADLFASELAQEIFGWDTARDSGPEQVVRRILAQANPPGNERAGLEADLAGYVPSAETWERLRDFQTRQALHVHHVVRPAAWDTVDTASLPEGVQARTVEGIRRRDGLAFGADVQSEHIVTFTIFMACPLDDGPCTVLRLSRLNEPLR